MSGREAEDMPPYKERTARGSGPFAETGEESREGMKSASLPARGSEYPEKQIVQHVPICGFRAVKIL
jgi:hypothetical protein